MLGSIDDQMVSSSILGLGWVGCGGGWFVEVGGVCGGDTCMYSARLVNLVTVV